MSAISPFEQLIAAAASQPEPQVLLFVFAGAELPANPSQAERARFEAGAGRELTPLMCVEKAVDELSTFDALVQESREVGPPWSIVFAAGISGTNGKPPAAQAVDGALRTMIERIKHGTVDGFLAFSSTGSALSFA